MAVFKADKATIKHMRDIEASLDHAMGLLDNEADRQDVLVELQDTMRLIDEWQQRVKKVDL
ncbi:hypothetical protein [Paracoccus haeundaensis]|uniref:Uncharacterized protein n=1 Tax=Paracoccus haeundaensis TaxID=225362 RepID=A0A5C4RC04_9RHOB|nr:hypothetical protein [Paracoccus haeundaensis]TNH41267.1 hypothetical protein FHD67_00705 [Paracoccus haeundaensis]